jgi:hypothetical protein
MAILYSEIDKTDWYYEPNFVRMRHRYRGIRESYKTNTEITQYYYDIRNIFNKAESTRDDLDDYTEKLIEGGSVDGCEYYWSEGATPVLGEVNLLGIDELASRIDKLRNRVKMLERNQ